MCSSLVAMILLREDSTGGHIVFRPRRDHGVRTSISFSRLVHFEIRTSTVHGGFTYLAITAAIGTLGKYVVSDDETSALTRFRFHVYIIC